MEWRRLEQKPDLWQPRTEQCAHKSSVKTWMQFKPTEWAIAGVLALISATGWTKIQKPAGAVINSKLDIVWRSTTTEK